MYKTFKTIDLRVHLQPVSGKFFPIYWHVLNYTFLQWHMGLLSVGQTSVWIVLSNVI